MTIQGTVVMIALSDGPANSCSGPGADIAPRPTATMRSSRPKLFHSQIAPRQVLAAREARYANGSAVTPITVSPHPATGANGAGSLPAK